MSRRLQRQSANASSLLGLKQHQKYCACGAPGKACYGLEGDLAGFFCEKHRRSGGYCVLCGDALTKEEVEHNLLGMCSKHMNWEVPF